MYIVEEAYGGIDWHDSKTILKQLKDGDSYNVEKGKVNQIIAERIAGTDTYSSIENVSDKILRAISEKTTVTLVTADPEWKCDPKPKGNKIIAELTFAEFDGNEMKLTEEYFGGQISYVIYFDISDIPAEKICYVVTEDFLAPMKGCPVVQRLWHDVFDDLYEAENYMESFKKHDLPYCDSVKTFLISNRDDLLKSEWYQAQKEAMQLMEEKKQSCFDDSFEIFTEPHIEMLKKI